MYGLIKNVPGAACTRFRKKSKRIRLCARRRFKGHCAGRGPLKRGLVQIGSHGNTGQRSRFHSPRQLVQVEKQKTNKTAGGRFSCGGDWDAVGSGPLTARPARPTGILSLNLRAVSARYPSETDTGKKRGRKEAKGGGGRHQGCRHRGKEKERARGNREKAGRGIKWRGGEVGSGRGGRCGGWRRVGDGGTAGCDGG